MAITPVPALTPIPAFPALSDRAEGTYNSKAFEFGSHMATKFNQEVSAVAQNVVQNAGWAEEKAVSADASAQAAQAAMSVATAAANATPWVSGKTYGKNDAVISQVNFQIYRRQVAGSSTTDPANDNANLWMPGFGNGAFTPREVTTATFDLSTGNYFTKTMSASETWVFDKCPSMGFGFTVELAYAGGTLTLPSTVRTPFNAPVSLTAGKTYMLTFITSNKGVTRWRLAMVENYDN